MGRYDSSLTRVGPVLWQLYDADPTGASWLDDLIHLAARSWSIPAIPSHQRLVAAHGVRWGANEVSLAPPLSLLEYLVQSITSEQVAANGDTGETLAKRTRLAQCDPATIDEAIEALRTGHRGRKWFVLEGASRPDALLETEDLVICVEGKRTEKSCTTDTTWMGTRSQLIRHMDAALEAFPTRRVLGLLVVEGDGDADAVEPSTFWMNEAKAQRDEKMLLVSLPHRNERERAQIADGILGATTWQAICRANGLAWPPAPDLPDRPMAR